MRTAIASCCSHQRRQRSQPAGARSHSAQRAALHATRTPIDPSQARSTPLAGGRFGCWLVRRCAPAAAPQRSSGFLAARHPPGPPSQPRSGQVGGVPLTDWALQAGRAPLICASDRLPCKARPAPSTPRLQFWVLLFFSGSRGAARRPPLKPKQKGNNKRRCSPPGKGTSVLDVVPQPHERSALACQSSSVSLSAAVPPEGVTITAHIGLDWLSAHRQTPTRIKHV